MRWREVFLWIGNWVLKCWLHDVQSLKQLKSKWVGCFCFRTFCVVKCCVGLGAFSSAVCVYNTCNSLWWNECSYVMEKDPVTRALYIHLSSTLSVGNSILQCKIRSSHVRGYMIRHRWAHNTTPTAQRMWAFETERSTLHSVYFAGAMYLCVSYDSQKKINYFSTQRGEVRLGFGNRVFSEGWGRCKNSYSNSTFRWPWIVINSYNKTN